MSKEIEIRKVPLDHVHRALGAKIIPFAGYDMPVRYTSQTEEHLTVREAVGIFDVSHMGEFLFQGPGAFELVQKVTSNDVSLLVDGQAQYSCLPNLDGGIVDDLLVYRIAADKYYLVVNASNIDKDWDWIQSFNTEGVDGENLSDDYCLFAVQGPKAAEALQALTPHNLAEIPYYHFEIGTFAGVEDVIISATGYTGSGGFELYIKNADAETVWTKILEAGAPQGIKPIGLAARDTLRLEKGFCLYGMDINDETSPLEAGLGWITKLGEEFTNRDYFVDQKEKGLSKRLVGFELLDKGIPRHDYEILNEAGTKVGVVTSGTMSPSLGKGIGLAYIDVPFHKKGTDLFLAVRKKQIPIRVCKIPFL